jgi:hypothetical protein
VLTGPQQAKWRSPPLSVPLARSLLGLIAPKIAGLPDFYGIALTAGVIAALAVLASAFSDYYYIPAVFCGLSAVMFWWIATGLDGWAPGGGGNRQHGRSSPLARNCGIRGFPRRSVHPARMGLHLQRGLVARWAPSRPGVRQARRHPDPRHAAVRERASRILIDQAPIARRRDASFAVSRSAPLQETL